MHGFRDRVDAGERLGQTLLPLYGGRPDLIVLGLPRGGVPVAHEVAKALEAPLDVFIVRKLGLPGYEELAMGAIATGGVQVLNPDVVSAAQVPEAAIQLVSQREALELRRREIAYRGHTGVPELAGKFVILVDDGVATGASIRAAIEAVRRQEPSRLVVAVPTAPRSTVEELSALADDVVVLISPEPFHAVGNSYENFEQTTDEEVRRLLAQSGTSR